MAKQKSDVLSDVAGYYTARLTEHGSSARGVDWNGEASQQLRFSQLFKIVDDNREFSINDIGCGYGALVDFLENNASSYLYHGNDISAEMIEAARRKHSDNTKTDFSISATPSNVADYCVASGIFNVRLDHSKKEWEQHMEATVEVLHEKSRIGFAFNCLTSYSDKHLMKKHLYYANPTSWFEFCRRRYSRNVALLHDYDLFEFTILVRKSV